MGDSMKRCGRMIIEHGAEVNASDTNGRTPLHNAASGGMAEMVSMLCLKGAAIDALDIMGRTALQKAVLGGHTAATRALLAAGADVTLRRGDMSALDMAAHEGHVDVARAIIEHGTDVNAAGRDGLTPLHYATDGDKAKMVSLLCLRWGAAVDAVSVEGFTSLHVAAIRGKAAASRALLAAGANVTLRFGELHWSALDLAAKLGHVEVARAIIEHGADPNDSGAEGSTPLHNAAGSGMAEMVSLLCLKGAAIDALDVMGRTALQKAVLGGHAAATRALLVAGADVTRRSSDVSALDIAASLGHVDLARAMIEHGADVNAPGIGGFTPLLVAAVFDKAGVIDAIVEAGGNVGRVGGVGNTPIHYAVKAGSRAAVLALLKHGARVSVKNAFGETPLHVAAAMAGKIGTAEVVDILLRWGADENATTSNSQTALNVLGSEIREQDLVAEDVGVAEDIGRVLRLLANAPADRAWRRRGFLVMCRAHYPGGRVHLKHGSNDANASIAKRTRSRLNRPRAEIDWAGVASMLMRVGGDPISVMGDGADLIFENIVGFL